MYKFLLPLFALAFLLVSCGSQTPAAPTPGEQSSTSSSVTPPVAVDTSAPLAAARASYDGKLLKGKHKVILHTTKGNVTLELDAAAAPKTVTNFILLAKAGYYDNLTFHRVIPSFMIQGGDPNGNGSGGESVFGPRFEDEINANTYGLDKKKLKDVAAGQELPPDLVDLTIKQLYEKQGYKYTTSLKSLPFERGAIAMANAGPSTNGSQFFIVEAPKVEWLEGKHTVFGKVTAGMEVVDAIVNAERDGDDRPTTPVTFTVEVLQ